MKFAEAFQLPTNLKSNVGPLALTVLQRLETGEIDFHAQDI